MSAIESPASSSSHPPQSPGPSGGSSTARPVESPAVAADRRVIRRWLWVVIWGLVLSGATALPLETELRWLAGWLGVDGVGGLVPAGWVPEGLAAWVGRVRDALVETNARHPFLAYGTDWLAFAHFVIAVAFIGPLRDPVRNVWVVEFGLVACVLVVPFALVMGGVRGIPIGWRLIDCSFGVFAFFPLWWCRARILRLEAALRLAGGAGGVSGGR